MTAFSSFFLFLNQQRARRRYMHERLCIALIDSDGKMSARIYVQQRIPFRDIAEGPYEWHGVGFFRQRKPHLIADLVPKFCKPVGFDVGDQVSIRTVNSNRFAVESASLDGRLHQVEAY